MGGSLDRDPNGAGTLDVQTGSSFSNGLTLNCTDGSLIRFQYDCTNNVLNIQRSTDGTTFTNLIQLVTNTVTNTAGQLLVNPTGAAAPFVLGANAAGQGVVDLVANKLGVTTFASDGTKTFQSTVVISSIGASSQSFTGDGSDGAITAPVTISGVKFYSNVTVNSGDTLTIDAGGAVLYINGTLTLNGTIRSGAIAAGTSNGGLGGSGGSASGGNGGSGGDGGQSLVIFANKITGTGTINMSGYNGVNGAAGITGGGGSSDGADGTSGENGAEDPIIHTGNPGGGTFGSGGVQGGTGGARGTGGSFPANRERLIEPTRSSFVFRQFSAGGGAGGGEGAGGGLIGCGGGGGGAGGAGYGGGGNGGVGGGDGGANGTAAGGGAGAGGGSGNVMIVCPNVENALTIQCNGGNGANGGSGQIDNSSGSGGGGGGGGGGFVLLLINSESPLLLSNVSISGGTGGTAGPTDAGGAPPGNGVAGSDGLEKLYYIN